MAHAVNRLSSYIQLPLALSHSSPPFARLVLLAALLPYLNTSPLNSDNQPHFYLVFSFALCFYALRTGRLPFGGIAIFLSLTLGTAALLMGGGVNAIALYVLPLAVAYFVRVSVRDIVWVCKATLILYFIGVLVEIISPDIVGALTSNWRGLGGRGFKSFASEPSYLGLVATFLAVIFMYLKQRLVWVAGAVLLALSSGSLAAIAPLFLILASAYVRKDSLHWLVAILVTVGALYHLAPTMDNRIGNLVSDLRESPGLILQDVSVSNRIGRAFSPIHEASATGFIPRGFPGEYEIPIQFEFISDRADQHVRRLSSLATVFIYVFGLFSLPLIALYLYSTKAPLFIYLTLIYFCTTNISIATPYLYILIAVPLLREVYENVRFGNRVDGSGLPVQLPLKVQRCPG